MIVSHALLLNLIFRLNLPQVTAAAAAAAATVGMLHYSTLGIRSQRVWF
jgi:hypothetical protein